MSSCRQKHSSLISMAKGRGDCNPCCPTGVFKYMSGGGGGGGGGGSRN